MPFFLSKLEVNPKGKQKSFAMIISVKKSYLLGSIEMITE